MTKKSYSAPTIHQTTNGYLDKHPLATPDAPVARITGARVDELLDEFGSPLFVFSESMLREKYREAYRAFSTRYPKVQFAWSYKTNYLKAICNVFHEEGAIAEVVSDFEYEKARNLGMRGDQIIVNGPYKSEEFLNVAKAPT
jgi:diaminopimelate decarboxylase